MMDGMTGAGQGSVKQGLPQPQGAAWGWAVSLEPPGFSLQPVLIPRDGLEWARPLHSLRA